MKMLEFELTNNEKIWIRPAAIMAIAGVKPHLVWDNEAGKYQDMPSITTKIFTMDGNYCSVKGTVEEICKQIEGDQ